MVNDPERKKRPIIRAKWPISLVTNQGVIDGELRTVTDAGAFIHCDKPLRHNEIYRMVIRPTPEMSLEVKGKLILSNPGRSSYGNNLSSMTLSFVKFSKGDHLRLKNLIAAMEVNTVEILQRVKIKLHIETDQRSVEKEFSNLFDLRKFMDHFFALPDVVDRRTGQSILRYTGQERRMIMMMRRV